MFKKLKDFFYSNEAANPAETIADANEQIITALKTVYDPEIPLNIYELGLIYGFTVDEHNQVHIEMTLTTPGCPVAETFPKTVADAVKEGTEFTDVTVELVWEPPWTMDRMSDTAKLQLNLL